MSGVRARATVTLLFLPLSWLMFHKIINAIKESPPHSFTIINRRLNMINKEQCKDEDHSAFRIETIRLRERQRRELD